MFVAFAVYDKLYGLAYHLLKGAEGRGFGDLSVDGGSFVDGLLGDLLHLKGGGGLFVGVVEGVEAVESEIFHEAAEFFKALLTLSGVSGDDGGADEGIGFAFHMLEQGDGLFLSKTAFHRLEHTVVDVLDGHVVVGLEDLRVSNIVNEFEGGRGGVEVEDACTVDPLYRLHSFDELP